ncbi:MAG: acetyl-CoA carboxylase biotin carboxyl carrier protein [Saprospiraceae bacterium]|nr:acetyl-CoA carboxylase biotin carboxyl carrier protein [Saprospiraceae bacterium]
MNFKEIQELLKLINKLELTEFKMKDGEFEVSVRTKHYERGNKGQAPIIQAQAPAVVPMPQVQPISVPPAAPAVAAAPAAPAADAAQASKADSTANYLEVKSPMVGTFYRSASPEKPAYVKVGDTIESGSVVCIVEAMKLFNEIEAEVSGKIVKVMVEDASPVEYDQVLFLVDPNG